MLIKYLLRFLLVAWLLVTTTITVIFFYNHKSQNLSLKKEHVLEDIRLDYRTKKIEGLFLERFYGNCDSKILDYANLYLSNFGDSKSKARPCQSGQINENVFNKFKELYDLWPGNIRNISEMYIAAVYIIKNLGVSGFTLPVGSNTFIILIDEERISLTPNEWFTKSENSIVAHDSSNIIIDGKIEVDSDTSPAFTLENIMIHELGHCFGSVTLVTPFAGADIKIPQEYQFFEKDFLLEPLRWKLTINNILLSNFTTLGSDRKFPVSKYSSLLSF